MANPPLMPLPQQENLDDEQKLHLLLSQMMPNHWNHRQSWCGGLEVGWLVGKAACGRAACGRAACGRFACGCC